jgi:DNA-binding transcriptional LysR family regulator
VEHRQLKTFAAVARTLSFTRAARELGYVQSNVTAQVKALEREFGVPLFDRLGRRVVLTDAGKTLLPYAKKMLDLSEETRAVVAGGSHGEPAGTVRIGATETLSAYRLPELFRRMRSRFPHVEVRFRPVPYTEELKGLVAEGSLDVAFTMEGPVRSAVLRAEALVEEPLLVVAPPEHPLATSKRVFPKDLNGEAFVLTEAGCRYRQMFGRELARAGVELGAALEFDSVEAIKRCVGAGMGVTVLPAVVVETELSRGELVALRWAGEDLRIQTQVIWHKDKWVSPALAALLSESREILGSGEARSVA